MKTELPETLTSVGFIGGGNMGFALARAVFARFPELTIHVCDPKPQRTALFRRELPRTEVNAGTRGGETDRGVGTMTVLERDQEQARMCRLKESLFKRFLLTEGKIDQIVASVRDVKRLADPVGKTLFERELD